MADFETKNNKYMHTTAAAKQNSRSFSEPKKRMLHREKDSYTHTSREYIIILVKMFYRFTLLSKKKHC